MANVQLAFVYKKGKEEGKEDWRQWGDFKNHENHKTTHRKLTIFGEFDMAFIYI